MNPLNPLWDRPVEALIFDMDGTMIDSMPHHAQSWLAFLRRHGLTMQVDELMRRTTGRTGPECMRELFQCDMQTTRVDQLVGEKELLYRELFSPVFAEVAGFKQFSQLARKHALKLGVGTAGGQSNIDFAFFHLKLAALPHAVVGGDQGLPGKPEPDIFLEVARRLKVEPGACIVFEDAPFGIEAARRAGMRAVAVCSGHTPRQLAGPHVLASVRDYVELMQTDFLQRLTIATA